MEIAFASKRLRSICENASEAEISLGIESAVKLRRRLADLRAASTLSDFIVGRAQGRGEDLTEMRIELTDTTSLVMVQNHMMAPLLKSGSINWKKVSRVKILKISQTL